MPTECPSCGEGLVRPEGEAMTYCVNAACPAQLRRLLEHFVSRGAMDIEGLGVRQVVILLERGLIHDAADMYALKDPAGRSRRDRPHGRKERVEPVGRHRSEQGPSTGPRPHRPWDRPRGLRGGGGTVTPLPHHRRAHVRDRGPPVAGAVHRPQDRGQRSAYFANESNRAVVQKLARACTWPTRSGPNPASSPSRACASWSRAAWHFSRSQAEGRIKDAGGAQRQRQQAHELPGRRGGRGLQARRRREAGHTCHRRGRVHHPAGARPTRSTCPNPSKTCSTSDRGAYKNVRPEPGSPELVCPNRRCRPRVRPQDRRPAGVSAYFANESGTGRAVGAEASRPIPATASAHGRRGAALEPGERAVMRLPASASWSRDDSAWQCVQPLTPSRSRAGSRTRAARSAAASATARLLCWRTMVAGG